MRQRYYNVDIRRFINQDIITGDIANSQSLNRYCYVQGNPVKYTDPFGLSPEDGGNKGGNFWHSLLGFVGMIPGPVGVISSMITCEKTMGIDLLDMIIILTLSDGKESEKGVVKKHILYRSFYHALWA